MVVKTWQVLYLIDIDLQYCLRGIVCRIRTGHFHIVLAGGDKFGGGVQRDDNIAQRNILLFDTCAKSARLGITERLHQWDDLQNHPAGDHLVYCDLVAF